MDILNVKKSLSSNASLACSALLLLFALSSWARCAIPTVEEDFQANDVVFAGTVSAVDDKEEEQSKESVQSSEDATLTVHFKLDKKWKGVDGDTIAITTPSSDYGFICAIMRFSVGDRYVIFANTQQDTSGSDVSEHYYTDGCSANKKLDDSSVTEGLFKQLDALKSNMQMENEEVRDQDVADQEA